MEQFYKLDTTVGVENPYMIMPDANEAELSFQAFCTRKNEIAKKHIKKLQAFIDSKPSIAELQEFGIHVSPCWVLDEGGDVPRIKTVRNAFFAESQMKARITESIF